MTEPYNYRPKFTDMRIRKPMAAFKGKIEEKRTCEAEGCSADAKCKAPKSRDNPALIWWFCEKHAAEYNKSWNFFEGMSHAEWKEFESAGRHGHRPTWAFGAKAGSRESATLNANNRFGGKPGQDFYSRTGRPRRTAAHETASNASAPIIRALEDLGLNVSATSAEVRRTYADLVRRFHPDSNGGDRSAEARLQIVVKAYKVLKASKRG